MMEHGPLMLHDGDRRHAVTTLQQLDRMVGESDGANHSRFDEFGDGTDGLLDRHGRVRIVQLEYVDVIGAETAQTHLELGAHGGRRSILDP